MLLAVRLGEKALEERENAAKDEAAQLRNAIKLRTRHL